MIGEWPETAIYRDEPRKMTYSLETQFFWGGLNGKVVAQGILVICPVDKNSRLLFKKLTFGPKYLNFWVKYRAADEKLNFTPFPKLPVLSIMLATLNDFLDKASCLSISIDVSMI